MKDFYIKKFINNDKIINKISLEYYGHYRPNKSPTSHTFIVLSQDPDTDIPAIRRITNRPNI